MSSSVIYGVLFFTIVLSSFLSSGVSANCQDAIERGLSIFQVNEPTEGDLNSCRSAGSEFFVVKFADDGWVSFSYFCYPKVCSTNDVRGLVASERPEWRIIELENFPSSQTCSQSREQYNLMLTKQPSEEYKNLCNSLKGKFFEVSYKTTSSQVTLYRCFPFFCSPDDVREKVLLEDPSLVDIQVNSGYRLASFSLTIVALLSSLIF